MKLDNVNVSCIKCIGYYHNSSRKRHGMHLQLDPFTLKQFTSGLVYPRNSSYLLSNIYDWSSVLPKEL